MQGSPECQEHISRITRNFWGEFFGIVVGTKSLLTFKAGLRTLVEKKSQVRKAKQVV